MWPMEKKANMHLAHGNTPGVFGFKEEEWDTEGMKTIGIAVYI